MEAGECVSIGESIEAGVCVSIGEWIEAGECVYKWERVIQTITTQASEFKTKNKIWNFEKNQCVSKSRKTSCKTISAMLERN